LLKWEVNLVAFEKKNIILIKKCCKW
jgi:hypothetical protein